MTAALVDRAGIEADGAQIADLLITAWQQIDLALSPILGPRGVAALYNRSVHLTRAAHPWLVDSQEGDHTVMNLPSLQSTFAQQDSATASAAGGTLLQTFHELLTSMVGVALTERLLRAVWETLLGGQPAQETTS